MELKIEGRVLELLEEQSGEGRNGPWRKREFILETGGKYPRKVCITQWGDDIDQSGVAEGEQLTAYIDIQSREYNGRWYTDVKAWKIEREEARTGAEPAGRSRAQAPESGAGPEAGAGPSSRSGRRGASETGTYDPSGEDDDLPF